MNLIQQRLLVPIAREIDAQSVDCVAENYEASVPVIVQEKTDLWQNRDLLKSIHEVSILVKQRTESCSGDSSQMKSIVSTFGYLLESIISNIRVEDYSTIARKRKKEKLSDDELLVWEKDYMEHERVERVNGMLHSSHKISLTGMSKDL